MPRSLALFALLSLLAGAARATDKSESPSSAKPLCAGFPRLALKTGKGLCTGLVARNLGYLRGITIVGDDVWLADMGGWRKGHGRLLRIGQRGRGKVEVMLTRLDQPNALLTLPNGKILLGSAGRIDIIDPVAARPGHVILDPLMNALPDGGRHPVPAMAAATDGTLYVNIGSATDHCEGDGNAAPAPKLVCPETQETPPRGSIISTRWDHPQKLAIPASQATVVARGLRNSMALALDPWSRLWAAVNARDFINLADPALSDELLPPDTMVRVSNGADYGWPQCYGMLQTSPEYKGFDCNSKTAPTLLLPAHAAPLGMIHVADSHALGPLRGGFLIAYHGYRKTGHRIVWLQMTHSGDPMGEPIDVVWDWESHAASSSKQKRAFSEDGTSNIQGSPVALAQLEDGSVLVTDDHNGTLIEIAAER
jgi:glucose/arabinose dehydrogenase